MDTGGIPASKPFYDRAKATFTTLVDSQNAMGEAFGFKVVPNGFMVDEAGVLRDMKVGGFEVNSPASVKLIEAFFALPPAEAEREIDSEVSLAGLRALLALDPNDPKANLQLGRRMVEEGLHDEAKPYLEKAAAALPKSSAAQFAWGSWLLAKKRNTEALGAFRKALGLDRENFLIRKQIWMIEHPEKFHPTIDWAWQRDQLRKERAAERDG